MVATFPLLAPLINWPLVKLKAPGLSSTIFMNSLVASETDNSTVLNESPINADIFSPTTKF